MRPTPVMIPVNMGNIFAEFYSNGCTHVQLSKNLSTIFLAKTLKMGASEVSSSKHSHSSSDILFICVVRENLNF
jgi:hypothetical protein